MASFYPPLLVAWWDSSLETKQPLTRFATFFANAEKSDADVVFDPIGRQIYGRPLLFLSLLWIVGDLAARIILTVDLPTLQRPVQPSQHIQKQYQDSRNNASTYVISRA
jgi:hypothetical protein